MIKNLSDSELIEVINQQHDSAYEFRERRHTDWNENYTLYRDKVLTNRLTQRQSVNIPLMKYALTTLLKDVDDPPALYFDNLDNDIQTEIFYNEYWKESARRNRLVIKDIIDKKQAFLYGRTFKKLNIVNGEFYTEIIDPQDILVDRFVDPADIDTARCLIHTGIYRTVSELEETPEYSKVAITKIKEYFASEEGLLEGEENFEEAIDKQGRMANMGLDDVWNPVLGEQYVQLHEVYMYQWDTEKEAETLHLTIVAATKDENHILVTKPLREVLGDTEDDYWCYHLPYTTWAADPERTDFWSDGIADILRTPNRVLNVWFSQLVENRTLRNFGMQYFDATKEEGSEPFVPQTFEPRAWGWYPVPGNPKDKIMRVEIPDLSESLDEMQFLLNLSEKAVAATSTQTGSVEKSSVTLGEVELALANAKERIKSMAIFYTQSWQEFGEKYAKLLEANADMLDEMTITKKGRKGLKNYTRVIKPEEIFTKNGYAVQVKMVQDKQAEDVESLTKLDFLKKVMPTNEALQDIYERRAAEFAGLSPDEVTEVMEAQRQLKLQALTQADTMQDMGAEINLGVAPNAPVQSLI